MPLRSVPRASLVAALVALSLCIGLVLLDIATDMSGQASDAAARGAMATPLALALLFAVYLAIGYALVASGKPTFAKAASLSLAAALILVAIPAIVSILYSGDPVFAASTYMPWIVGVAALAVALLPGSLLQAWLLGQRHNISLERGREG